MFTWSYYIPVTHSAPSFMFLDTYIDRVHEYVALPGIRVPSLEFERLSCAIYIYIRRCCTARRRRYVYDVVVSSHYPRTIKKPPFLSRVFKIHKQRPRPGPCTSTRIRISIRISACVATHSSCRHSKFLMAFLLMHRCRCLVQPPAKLAM